ncbi:NAD(P)H:quinone oxidoreductase [Pedobacter gandavensis]|uniref:NAD(P)H:quinone oxidoreductase n=1 Tax=Pedobacter gandavensis TaxID=2679963 RepID=UPI002478442E|nr:NAD(P)H:quinone oxidoreductase [Pedobacter gandavensis]WGQ11805.1 NAD(P)H:quinone oxidoreductase [Pedobacter gandavensis]
MNFINSIRVKTGLLVGLCLLSIVSLKAQRKMNTKSSALKVLVLFNTESGGSYKMAKAMADGIEKFPGATAVLKQVPRIKPLANEDKQAFANVPYAVIDELPEYDGIAFGSAVHFGNMSADMRYFLDQSVGIWTARKLEGKPATVFMSAGSGAGREAAILSFWSTLAVHGMLIVPTGIMGNQEIDKTIPQGNTAFGTTSLAGANAVTRPSAGELHLAALQGYALAKAAKGYQETKNSAHPHSITGTLAPGSSTIAAATMSKIEARLKALNITLPEAPAPVGNYKPFRISGKQVFINQIALNAGKVDHPGMVGTEVTEEQAKLATRQTLLNVLAVLKQAAGGNLDQVKQAVQLTGFFYTAAGYTKHALLMNEASNLLVEILGESGMHTRATVGASSLPMNSAVEIQAIFELE